MKLPQLLIIFITGLEIGAAVVMDGQPKTGNIDCLATTIAHLIILSILYAGGFFSR